MSLTSLNSTGVFRNTIASMRQSQADTLGSTGRLSSGERITRAADDVANLAVSTKLQTRITGFRSALINTAQASSLLQVADGGLQQIGDQLQRMAALATQANSGGISDTERGFLNIEFKQLQNDIDRIAGQTKFNGIEVLNGQVSTPDELLNALEFDGTIDELPSVRLDFFQNPTNNQTLRLQDNQLFRFRNVANPNNPLHIQRGADISETVQNLADHLSNYDSDLFRDFTFTADGSELVITAKAGGPLGRDFTIDEQSSSSRNRFNVVGGTIINTGGEGRYILGGTLGTGLQAGNLGFSGGIDASNPVLTNQLGSSSAEARIDFTANPTNNRRIRIDNGFGGSQVFQFRNVVAQPFHIQIGATLEESLKNAVAVLRTFEDNEPTGTDTYAPRLLDFERDGDALVIRYKGIGEPVDLRANPFFIDTNVIGATLTIGTPSSAVAGTLTGGGWRGFNFEDVVNPDFVGTVSGFEARYIADNVVDLSLTVGSETYSSRITKTAFGPDTIIRMESAGGGFFLMELKPSGLEVKSQDEADDYARYFDQAFAGLTFYQERTLTTFSPATGSLLEGTSISMRLQDYDEQIAIDDVTVYFQNDPRIAGQSLGARIEVTINGEVFRNREPLEDSIEPYQNIILQSQSDSERQFIFKNVATELFLRDATEAQTFEDALLANLPLGELVGGGEADTIEFLVGARTSNTLTLEIVNATTTTLFDDDSINLMSIEAAQEAANAVREAIDRNTALRADVGSRQQQLDFTAANLESSLAGLENARAVLGDTNIADESTSLALTTVKLNLGISVLAQANNIKRSIFADVFGFGGA